MGTQLLPIDSQLWRRQQLLRMLAPESSVSDESAPVEPTTLERYKQFVEAQPDISQYKPGILRRILSGLASMESPEVGQEILYRPYAQKVAAWKQRLGGLGDIARAETEQAKAQAEIAERGAREAYYGRGARAWVPTTEAEAIRLKEAGVRPPTPTPYYYEGLVTGQGPLPSYRGKMEVMPGGEPRLLGPVAPPTIAETPESKLSRALTGLREKEKLFRGRPEKPIKPPSATDVTRATQNIAIRLLNDPRYSPYLEPSKDWPYYATTRWGWRLGPRDKDEVLEEFKQELMREVRKYELRGATPPAYEFPDEESDYEITEEEPEEEE